MKLVSSQAGSWRETASSTVHYEKYVQNFK